MTRPKLVQRVRRKTMGGRLDMRIYADGSANLRFDHPSNDPEIEMAMAGRGMKLAQELFAKHGMEPKFGPVTWRDNPDK